MVANAAEAVWLPLVEQARLLEPDPALAAVDDAALEGRVRDVAAQVAQLTCQWLELATEFVVRGVWADRGARTPGQWLSWACGVAPGTAREYVRVGLALRRLPQVRERFAAGTISYSKVRAVTRVATPATQGQLLQLADSAPAADLERIVAGARTQLRRTGAEGSDDPVGQVVDGPVLWRRSQDDGAVEYRLRLPAEVAEAFDQRLDRLVELADREDDQPPLDATGEDPGNGEDAATASVAGRVPRSHREATAVCEALASAVEMGPVDRSGQDRHLVVLPAGLEDLVDVSAETPGSSDAVPDVSAETPRNPGPTDDAHADAADVDPDEVAKAPRRAREVVVSGRRRAMAVPASVLRWLACDAQVRGVDEGHPADAGRSSRTVPEPLRRALLLRDRGCRFPGCGATRHLHAHHVIHWVDGGPTDLANLLLLCGFHHRFVHRAGWQLDPVDPAAGHYRFQPPSGAPCDPAGTLPGVSAETPVDPADPWPHALQPPWWDGDPYDLSETINAVAERIRDPFFDPVSPRVHPAHDLGSTTPAPSG